MSVGYSQLKINGRVLKHLTAKDSMSEQQSVFLETKGGSYVLRRYGDNPLFDLMLEKLVGKNDPLQRHTYKAHFNHVRLGRD